MNSSQDISGLSRRLVGGWAWKKMHPLMQAAGHRLVTPTYTGLGERVASRQSRRSISRPNPGHPQRHQIRGPARHRAARPQLWRHGRDRRRRPRARRVSQLIYLDAFVPREGSRCSISTSRARADAQGAAGRRRLARAAESDAAGYARRPIWTGSPRAASTMPIKCFETKLKLQHGELTLPRSYIYCNAHHAGAIRSGSSPSERRTRRAGAISRSTPAIRRMSPRRKR